METAYSASVVLDATNLAGDLALKSPHLRLLIANARDLGYQVVLPEVVILEATNRFRETVMTESTKIEEAQRTLAALGVKVSISDIPDVDAAPQAYEQTVRQWLKSQGVAVAPIPPSASHERLLRRDLTRRKPFANSGKGYRDALIWETILSWVVGFSKPLVLVTNNRSDFWGSDKDVPRLAPDLLEDVVNAGGTPDAVLVLPDARRFVDKFIKPAEALTLEIRGLVQADPGVRQSLEEAIRTYLVGDSASGEELDLEEAEVAYGVFISVGPFHSFNVMAARPTGPDHCYVSVSANFDCSIDATVAPEDGFEWNQEFEQTYERTFTGEFDMDDRRFVEATF